MNSSNVETERLDNLIKTGLVKTQSAKDGQQPVLSKRF